jgi:hypothetical protein
MFISVGLVQGLLACIYWFQYVRYYYHPFAVLVWTCLGVAYAYFHKKLIAKHQNTSIHDSNFGILLYNSDKISELKDNFRKYLPEEIFEIEHECLIANDMSN